MSGNELLQTIHSRLAQWPRLRRQKDALDIRVEDGVVVLDGTVDGIDAKRLIPRIVAITTGGMGVHDRLRVAPHERREDGEIAGNVVEAISSDALFADYPVSTGRIDDLADDPGDLASMPERIVCVDVSGSVVLLSGTVERLRHRRIAEVLAWQAPGSCDVDNRLYVSPSHEDSDEEITRTLRIVLEKDPLVDARHVAIRTHDRIVTLRGMLAEQAQKQRSEEDAWYLPGVHEVDNRIRVIDPATLQECADEASRESFPASDPPSMTAVIGVGGVERN